MSRANDPAEQAMVRFYRTFYQIMPELVNPEPTASESLLDRVTQSVSKFSQRMLGNSPVPTATPASIIDADNAKITKLKAQFDSIAKDPNIIGGAVMRFFSLNSSNFQSALKDIKNAVILILRRRNIGELKPESIRDAHAILSTFKTGGPHRGEPDSLSDRRFNDHWNYCCSNNAGFGQKREILKR